MKTANLKFIKILLFVIGAAVTTNGIVLSFTTNLNIGNLLTLTLGIAHLSYGIFFERINKTFPKWVKAVFCFGLVAVLVSVSSMLIYGTSDTVTYKEDAIIVLGAGLHKDVPSLVLRDRLDTAAEYHQKNPQAVIVVSGGQGPQETVTEASAMEKYLVSKGVNKAVILKEEESTSTFENFVNSKKILDEHFEGSYTVAFITNEYHVYRAGGISKTAGIENAAHTHSSTRWYSVLPGTLRECLAVVKFWLFKT